MQVFISQDVVWWTGVDYCDVFIICLDSHSDGTHSLQSIHWWASDVMLHFRFVQMRVNTVRRKEVSCSHLFTKIKTSEHLQRSCLCFLKVNGAFKFENPSSMKAQCMGTLAVTLTHCRCKRCETGSVYLLICPLSLSPLHLLISSLLIS